MSTMIVSLSADFILIDKEFEKRLRRVDMFASV